MGVDIVKNKNRASSLLKDFARGEYVHDINLAITALEAGVVDELVTNKGNPDLAIRKGMDILVAELYIDKLVAAQIVGCWNSALNRSAPSQNPVEIMVENGGNIISKHETNFSIDGNVTQTVHQLQEKGTNEMSIIIVVIRWLAMYPAAYLMSCFAGGFIMMGGQFLFSGIAFLSGWICLLSGSVFAVSFISTGLAIAPRKSKMAWGLIVVPACLVALSFIVTLVIMQVSPIDQLALKSQFTDSLSERWVFSLMILGFVFGCVKMAIESWSELEEIKN